MKIREGLSRLIGLISRRRRVAALDDELRFHLAMAEEKHRKRGFTAEAARRAALVELGGIARTREAYADQQTLPRVEHVLQDARYGVRALLRAPAFTAAALLTIALGIGANVAIFSLVYAVLLRPLPYADADRIVVIGDTSPAGDVETMGFATVKDVRERTLALESVAAVRSWSPTLVVNGEAERLPAMRVSWQFFEMLGSAPAIGRGFTAAEDAPERYGVVILGDGLWRRRFGADPGVLGRKIRMNDVEFEIVGVMPPDFEELVSAHFYQPAEIWAPLGYDTTLSSACRTCRHLMTIGKIKAGVSLEQAHADLNAIRRQLATEHPNEYAPGEMAAERLADVLAGPVRPALLVLLGAVALILLIACANVANLLLARASTRSRELAVRAALGASRRRLVWQMLTESMILSSTGGALGMAAAAMLVRSLDSIAPIDIPRSVAIDGTVLTFAVALSLLTGVAFGLVPAMRVSALRVNDVLRADPRTHPSSGRARHVLVVADVALALVLLIGAGLMLRTVARLVDASPGFDPSGVLTLQFSLVGEAYREDAAVLRFQERLMEHVRALPGAEEVAIAGQIPMGGNVDRWGFHIEGRGAENPMENPSVERYSVTPDYFRTLRIPLLRGRLLTDRDTASSPPVMVVSETTARTLFGGEDPIGKRVRIAAGDTAPHTIVGIAGDVRHRALTDSADAQMYLPQAQVTDSYLVLTLRARNGRPGPLAADVRRIVRELDPAVPIYDVALLDDLVGRSFADRRFVMRLLTAFAGLALLLAGIGLYGLVSYVVAQRTREFGVRIALGARRSDILGLVLRAAAASLGIGLLIGVAGAAVLARWLDSLLFGIPPVDHVSIAAAVASLAAVALIAHIAPAARALCVDPVHALRND
jgi:putative ABC transport system permease protein